MEGLEKNRMKNSDFKVGILNPPDSHYRPRLFDGRKASYDFHLLNKDIYEGKKSAKDLNEKKTPKSVFVMLGSAFLGLAYLYFKKK